MVDYHVVMDLLPDFSSLYFERRFGSEAKLGAVQSSVLLALGFQRETIEQVEVCVEWRYSWACNWHIHRRN